MTLPPSVSPVQPKSSISPLLIIAIILLVILATNIHTRPILLIIGLASIIVFVHISGFVISGLLAGVQIECINIFYGFKLATFYFKHICLSIGSIPTGGSVSIKGMEYFETDAEQEGFHGYSLAWRLTIIASGPLALFLLASICIGSANAAHSITSGFLQIITGVFSPLSQGQLLIKQTVDLYKIHGFVFVLGVLSAKMTAFNLFPMPGINGGQLIGELFRTRIQNSKKIIRFTLLGSMLAFIITITWCVAIIKFVLVKLLSS